MFRYGAYRYGAGYGCCAAVAPVGGYCVGAAIIAIAVLILIALAIIF